MVLLSKRSATHAVVVAQADVNGVTEELVVEDIDGEPIEDGRDGKAHESLRISLLDANGVHSNYATTEVGGGGGVSRSWVEEGRGKRADLFCFWCATLFIQVVV